MKMLMITGGLLGFVISLTIGVVRHSDWSSILWRSAVSAYAAGMLLRWWGKIWIHSLKEVGEQRLAAARAKAEADRARKN